MNTASRKQNKSKFKLNTWHLIVPAVVIFLLGLWVLFGSTNRARTELRILQDPDAVPPVSIKAGGTPNPIASPLPPAPRYAPPLPPAQSGMPPTIEPSLLPGQVSIPQPIVASVPAPTPGLVTGPASLPTSLTPPPTTPPPISGPALSPNELELARHSMVYAVLPEDRQSNRNRGQFSYRGVPLRLSATASQPVIGTPGLVVQAILTQGIPGLTEAGAMVTGRVVQTVKNRILVEFFRLTTPDGTHYRMNGSALDTTDGGSGLVGISKNSRQWPKLLGQIASQALPLLKRGGTIVNNNGGGAQPAPATPANVTSFLGGPVIVQIVTIDGIELPPPVNAPSAPISPQPMPPPATPPTTLQPGGLGTTATNQSVPVPGVNQ
ncbi:MAG: hypothetical protein HY774_00135 [Acidobacteria bacterium]|nr:hypothetical protein [Acidobacteriota bacterium]